MYTLTHQQSHISSHTSTLTHQHSQTTVYVCVCVCQNLCEYCEYLPCCWCLFGLVLPVAVPHEMQCASVPDDMTRARVCVCVCRLWWCLVVYGAHSCMCVMVMERKANINKKQCIYTSPQYPISQRPTFPQHPLHPTHIPHTSHTHPLHHPP